MQRTAHRKHARSNNHYDLYKDYENIKSALADTAADLRGRAGEMLLDSVEGLRNKTTEIHDNLADYTSERPLKSMGAALAVGFFLGYLMHHRK